MCSSAKPSKGEKPKRAGMPKGWSPDDVDLDSALGCFRCRARSASIPRTASRSCAGIGRFGPYVQHGKTYANLESGDDVLNIGLNRAVTLIAEKTRKGPARAAASAPTRAARSASIPTRAGRSWSRRAATGPM